MRRRSGGGRGAVGRLGMAVGLAGLVALVSGCAPATNPGAPSPGTGEAVSPGVGEPALVAVPPTAATATSSAPADATPGSDTASATPAATTGSKVVRAKRIRIERLGIDLAIIEGDGIDAPIGKAAHYPGTAWPGGGSNIYVYGHARDGMFIDLWNARKGDRIELDLVDGTSRTYVVTRVLPRVRWDAVEYLEPTKTERLTVQTSTAYESTAPRFIVIAEPER